MRIERGPDPGPFTKPSDYKRKYKPFLRALFRSRCAYCLMCDEYSGGEEGATVDHFKSEKYFNELRFTWSNLYYACHVCNCHYKKQHPTPDEEAEGKRLVDPCAEDPDDHFRMIWDKRTDCFSRIRPLTAEGKYAVFRLKLNDRPHLRDHWRDIHHREQELTHSLCEIEVQLFACANIASKLDDPEVASLQSQFESQKQRCKRELKHIRSLRPFPTEAPSVDASEKGSST